MDVGMLSIPLVGCIMPIEEMHLDFVFLMILG